MFWRTGHLAAKSVGGLPRFMKSALFLPMFWTVVLLSSTNKHFWMTNHSKFLNNMCINLNLPFIITLSAHAEGPYLDRWPYHAHLGANAFQSWSQKVPKSNQPTESLTAQLIRERKNIIGVGNAPKISEQRINKSDSMSTGQAKTWAPCLHGHGPDGTAQPPVFSPPEKKWIDCLREAAIREV